MGKLSIVLNILTIPVLIWAIMKGYCSLKYNEVRKNMPSLTGKVAIVTGSSSGTGYYTALDLAKAGAHVILACRNMEKAQTALDEILVAVPDGSLEIMKLDVSSFKSVKSFASAFKKKFPGESLDMLVNNAGVMALPEKEMSVDSIEMQIATNHFGHFALTGLLYKSLAPNARVINHSSMAHDWGKGDEIMDSLLSEDEYDPWVAYGNSKLANLLFTYELNERFLAKGKSFMSIAVHPGWTATKLQRHFSLFETLNPFFGMRGEDGSLAQTVAAAYPDMQPSDQNYYGPQFMMFGPPVVTPTKSFAWNATNQDLLWALSEKLTGVQFLS